MRPADALAYPRMTFQRRTGARKSRVQFQGPFFRHFRTTLFRHGPTMPVCSGAPFPRYRRARQGMSDMCPVTATSKNPRKRRSASLWSRPAAFWAFPLGIPSKRLTGRSKARAAHCGIQQAAPYSVFAVGQTRLQSYLAKSASLCYNTLHVTRCDHFAD